MLDNLQVLDLLEISGSQMRAAHSLAMHQSTVSRCYRELAEQFHLQPSQGTRTACRWGISTSLRFLRLACRAHRLEDGRLRLATDALHQSLLDGLAGVLPVPPCFRRAADWAMLVTQGVIDGAIISSLCHDEVVPADSSLRWDGVRVIALGRLDLQLICHATWADHWDGCVLLPSPQVMPLLHQHVATAGSSIERSSRAWQDQQVWLEQLQKRPLAIPAYPALASQAWWNEQRVVTVTDGLVLDEQLWLLVPDDLELPRAARATLRLLRRRVVQAMAQQHPRGELNTTEPDL